jgi:hypothetical protein
MEKFKKFLINNLLVLDEFFGYMTGVSIVLLIVVGIFVGIINKILPISSQLSFWRVFLMSLLAAMWFKVFTLIKEAKNNKDDN